MYHLTFCKKKRILLSRRTLMRIYIKKLEIGLEPTTLHYEVKCSTDWAIPANVAYDNPQLLLYRIFSRFKNFLVSEAFLLLASYGSLFSHHGPGKMPDMPSQSHSHPVSSFDFLESLILHSVISSFFTAHARAPMTTRASAGLSGQIPEFLHSWWLLIQSCLIISSMTALLLFAVAS